MKAISLWQPWASLVAVGGKQVETRHWQASRGLVGERIAIHAAKTRQHLPVCQEPPFARYITDPSALPLGALVATAVLRRCTEITEAAASELERTRPDEFAFGNYTPGRFAWVLADVERLVDPVPFTGRQGIFDIPGELVGYPPAQTSLEVA